MVAKYFVYTLMSNKYVVCICMQIEKVRFTLQQILVCYHQLLTSRKFETIGRTVHLSTCTCMCMCPVALLKAPQGTFKVTNVAKGSKLT